MDLQLLKSRNQNLSYSMYFFYKLAPKVCKVLCCWEYTLFYITH